MTHSSTLTLFLHSVYTCVSLSTGSRNAFHFEVSKVNTAELETRIVHLTAEAVVEDDPFYVAE